MSNPRAPISVRARHQTVPSVRTISLSMALTLAGGVALHCSSGSHSRTDLSGIGTTTSETAAADATLLSACQRVSLLEFVPEAARFEPSAIVSLRARLSAADPYPCSTTLQLEVTHLGAIVHEQVQTVPLTTGIDQTAVLRWQPPARDFVGYMARLSIPESTEERTTGVDVSSSALVYPRYGFLSEFPPEQTPEVSREIVRQLSEQYHINSFQLYDWFWRHEDLLPRALDGKLEETWTDLFGRAASLATIRNLVAAIHAENAAALGYVALYAAREEYQQRSGLSPAWGLYEAPGAEQQVSLAFGGGRALYLFDPSNDAWRARMASEYIEAINELELDGVHIDQFGPRPTYYRADGTPVELAETFAPFLEAIDAALTANDAKAAACIFNLVDGAVDGYAVHAIASSTACDVLYSEIWFTTDTYEELRAYIEQLRHEGGQRPVVLALYPQYGQDVGKVLEAEDAVLSGVAIDDDQPGYTGSGFVDAFDAVGDSVTWTVELERDPTVTFVFRYANATGTAATRTLLVDDVPVGKLTFQSRSGWSEWAFDAWLQEYVAPGEHEIALSFAPDDIGAVNVDRLTLGAFDEASVRLQNAVVFASGATPIQIGDELQGLAHEYFPNRSKTFRLALREALRAQYSFVTAHETVLFASGVTPIDERLARISAVSEGHSLITDGSGGIWTALRQAPEGDVIHLVNLNGVDNALWRDASPVPIPQENIVLRYAVDDPSAITQIAWATPDVGPGTFTQIAFTRGDGYVEFTVPGLQYWDVVLVRSGTSSGAGDE